MDESKKLALDSYLNGFLLSDIKKIIGYLNDRMSIRISRGQRKGVLISLIVTEVVQSIANNNRRILDVLVEIMNELKMSQAFQRIDDHIEMVGAGVNTRSSLNSSIYSNTPRISAPTSSQYNIDYKTSPFYTIESRLAPPKICTSSMNTRASRFFSFEMTPEQQRFFEDRYPDDGRPLYEIRFFCTGYDTQVASRPKDIEFPAICEIKVNTNHTINGSAVRGMKNKPGTANPADLTHCCHLSSRRNAVEFVYAHTVKPYIGTIELVKRFPVPEIVKKLKATSIISKQETLQRLQQREADSDIVLESETISTKCPLGFTRIKTPSRSRNCQHLQCFDATTFLLMNQQTPTWSCPICNRKMESWEEVGVDEYFQDILAQVADSVDSIRIEGGGRFNVLDSDDADCDSDGDGEHTKRNRSRDASTSDDNNDNENTIDSVTILDDDHELDDLQDPDDIPLAKRYKTTTASPRPSEQPANTVNNQVIDLTLDSDDDDDDHVDEAANDNNNDNSNDSNNGTIVSGRSDIGQIINDNETETSNVHSASPHPNATMLSSSSVSLSPSTATDVFIPVRQPTTTNQTAPNSAASPITTVTTNSTLSPTTPPRNLIRLPWPPSPRQHPSIPTSSSNITNNQGPTINFAQEVQPNQPTNVYFMAPDTASSYPKY
ncbi:PINIT domain-domain-containing protein [Absidia repens]|uniref:PINIT domain-domain-containing protein n=1 Tax=Absidia repens TaxID=90262 RepID=A0A1X2IPB3_9FUNG|nr:PINIT domain-domain-containing protein [Absidia repens]